MLKQFPFVRTQDTKILTELNDSLMDILLAIDDGTIFCKDFYNHTSFRLLLNSIISRQRGPISHVPSGSWSLVPEIPGMGNDAFVEFVIMPTLLVSSILSRVLCEYPLFALSIIGYKDAMLLGMRFCTHHLTGHGYEMISGLAQSLKILSLGKVPWLLERHPYFCPGLHHDITSGIKYLQRSLSNGHARGLWGEDLQEEFNDTLVTYSILNDAELLSVIKSTTPDSELLNEEDISL